MNQNDYNYHNLINVFYMVCIARVRPRVTQVFISR